MPNSVIFSGNKVKSLKTALQLFDQATLSSGATDPSSVALTGAVGDAYLSTSTGKLYVKQDAGSSTNWDPLGTLISFTNKSVPFSDGAGTLTEDNADFQYDSVTNTLTITHIDAASSSITGIADAVQLTVKGNATQTSNVLEILKSDNTSLFDVDNAGAGTFLGTLSASNFSGSSSGSNTGDVTLTAVGASPSANGASLSGQALTLQPADSTNPGVLSAVTQSIGGGKSIIGNSDEAQLVVKGHSTQTSDVLDVLKSDNTNLFKVTNAGNGTFLGTVAASNFSGSSSGTNTGDVTAAAFGSSPNANALSLSGQAITLQPADSTNPGGVSISTQSFGGGKTIVGNIDEAQLVVKGNATQTSDVFDVIKSDNTNLFKVTNAGAGTFLGAVAASNFSGSSSGTNSGDVTLAAFGSSPNANGASLSGQALTLQPADATNPGGISTGAQTLAGSKTFSSIINADGGIDVSAAGTLTIGATNSTTINIGNAGATVNIQGTTIYENTPTLQVTDPTITINKGGAAASGQNSGIEIEEDSLITGYVQTSADRNSWALKAPNTAGIATITPGAGGITLNQSSHDAVTLGAVGSSPNANAASLSGQVLTLQPADGTNPGVVTTGAQTFAGTKTFSSTISGDISGNAGSASTVATTGVGTNASFYPLFAASSTNGNQAANLDSDLTYNPSTNTLTAATFVGALTGNADTATSATSATDATNAANVATTSVGTNASFYPLFAASSSNGNQAANLDADLTYNPSTNTLTASTFVGALTGTASGNLAKSTGDIDQTSFSAANNQVAAADVTGLAFANATVRSFDALVSVTIDATSDLFESFKLHGIQKGASWEMSQTSVGDSSGITFSITNAGQVQYTSSNVSGFVSSTMKFRAVTLAV